MGGRFIVQLGAMCAGIAALTSTRSASASQHYYAEVITPFINLGDADDGVYVNIETDILHSTCNVLTHNFVNHEMWYALDPNGNYWVEVGFKDGADSGNGCHTDVDFWADSRNGGGYHEHYPGNGWSMGSTYSAEITTDGTCAWSVLLGGISLGVSTANCPNQGRYLAAGIESTSQTTGSAKGFLSGFNEENSNAVWLGGWDSPDFSQNQQPFIKWIVTDSESEETLNEGW